MRIRQTRRVALVAAAATAIFTIQAGAAPMALPFDVIHGTDVWSVENDGGTSNGAPEGGQCNDSPGFGITDADTAVGNDAFDNALLLFLDDVVYADDDGTVDVTTDGADTIVTTDPSGPGDVLTTMQYRSLPNGIMRTTVTLFNGGAGTATPEATFAHNWGFDSGTVISGTSSGDTTFTTADRWLVTGEGDPSTDPIVTSVWYGTGASVTPSSVSETVFNCAGTQGGQASYNLSIPAGETVHLVFFNAILGGDGGTPNSDAVTAAAQYDAEASTDNPLFVGMTAAELAAVVNWQTPEVPETTTTTTTTAPAVVPVAPVTPVAPAVGLTPAFTG